MGTQNSRQDNGDKGVKLAQPSNNTTSIYLNDQVPGNNKPMTMLERTGLKGAFGTHANIHKTNMLQTFKRKSKAVKDGVKGTRGIAKAVSPGKLSYDKSRGTTNGKTTTHVAPARAFGKGTPTANDNKASKASTGQVRPSEGPIMQARGLK
jgi:hypothetical protein